MPNYNYETVVKPFLDECWKNKLNYELLRKYEKILTPLNVDQNTKEGLSCPHCFLFGPKYQPGKDNGGVFIFGKETAGCGCDKIGWSYAAFEGYNPNPRSREELMMETQTQFLFEHLEDSDGGRPFLKALRTIAGVKTGKEFLEANFIWDELIAMDYRGGSYRKAPDNDRGAIKTYSKAKLRMELELAEPKYAIFLIGDYDKELNEFLDLSWNIKPIGHKLTLTAAEEHPEPNKRRIIKDQQINEFWWNGIHCFATSHPCKWKEKNSEKKNGKNTENIYWDDLIAKKVWDFLAQEIKR